MNRVLGSRVAAAAAIVFGLGWDMADRPLYNPDETRYAEMAREMAERGDWLAPRVDGIPVLDKPPLLMWLARMTMAVFGAGEFGPRLVPFLAALAVAAMLYGTGRAMGGEPAGFWSAVVWSTSVLAMGAARIVFTDMLLCATTTASGLCFWRALQTGGARWAYLGWVAAALAFLTKGPVGFIIPAAGGVAYAIAHRGLDWRRLRPFTGIPLCLAVALPWFLLVQARYPDFFRWFFIVQNVGGFATSKVHHAGSAALPIAATLGGLIPWTPILIALAAADRPFWRESTPRFLALWAGLLVAFFTLSVAKLAPYQLPILPILALVGGLLLPRASGRAVALGCATIVLALVAAFLSMVADGTVRTHSTTLRLPVSLCVMTALLAGAGVGAFAVAWFGRPRVAASIVAAATIASVVPIMSAVREYSDERRSARELLREHADVLRDATVVVQGRANYAVSYYLRREVLYLGMPYELEHGMTLEPRDVRITVEQLRERVARERVALIIDAEDAPPELPGAPLVLSRTRGFYTLRLYGGPP